MNDEKLYPIKEAVERIQEAKRDIVDGKYVLILPNLNCATDALAAFIDKRGICEWTWDMNHDSWETSCGNTFCFIDGGPDDNKMNFCCYCGGELKEI